MRLREVETRLEMLRLTLLPFALLTATAMLACQGPVQVGELGEPGVDHVAAEVIVKYTDGNAASVATELGAIEARQITLLKHAEVLRFREGTDVSQVLGQIAGHTQVEYAEPNFIVHRANVPNDLSSSLWGLDNRGQTGGRSDSDIDAVEAWDTTTGSARVVVAVVDTGVDYNHPDLAPNIWRNTGETINGYDDDGNGYVDDVLGWDFMGRDNSPSDDVGHGTHVAGTIGARGNNGGLVGVNWNVRIMPLRFMGASGGDVYGAIEAIDYAIANGAQIINMSWAGPYHSRALREAIERAESAGVLVVCAAGNTGANLDAQPMYPAAYHTSNMITVGATDHMDRLASFSNYGSRVDLTAPGVDILSTSPGGNYAYDSGTSMAAPHVAGVAALLRAANPSLSVPQLKDAIIRGGDAISNSSGWTASGRRLNAAGAVQIAVGQTTNDEQTPGDEAQWYVYSLEFGTAHPYANSDDTTWELTVPGAQYVSVHFSGFHTESGYDAVYVYDANWNLYGVYDGNRSAFWSDAVPGETMYFRLVTDSSVQRYGFDLDAYAGWN